ILLIGGVAVLRHHLPVGGSHPHPVVQLLGTELQRRGGGGSRGRRSAGGEARREGQDQQRTRLGHGGGEAVAHEGSGHGGDWYQWDDRRLSQERGQATDCTLPWRGPQPDSRSETSPDDHARASRDLVVPVGSRAAGGGGDAGADPPPFPLAAADLRSASLRLRGAAGAGAAPTG